MTQKLSKLVFWGVRGSTPTPERDTWRYGGNTPCIVLMPPGGPNIILDCGTGLRTLGNRLAQAQGDSGIEAHILVTHYHWDHIQGIPFFRPFFEARNRFHFFSFQSQHLGRDSLRQVFEAQLASPYFPVNASMMTAARLFREIAGGDRWHIGDTHVTTAWLNHPQGCLGYRLDTSAGSFVYATDNEPGVPDLDRNLRELARDADVLIYDAQYSPEQLASSRKGWGHSSWLEGVKIARESNVANLILFHHDPDSADKTVDSFLAAARREFPSTWAASEGMSLTLGDAGINVALRETRGGQRRRLCFAATVSGRAQNGSAFEEKAVVQDISLQGAYLCLNHRPPLQSEVFVQIEAPGDAGQRALVSLRGIVVHCDPACLDSGGASCRGARTLPASSTREDGLHGVGVIFIEDPGQSSSSL